MKTIFNIFIAIVLLFKHESHACDFYDSFPGLRGARATAVLTSEDDLKLTRYLAVHSYQKAENSCDEFAGKAGVHSFVGSFEDTDFSARPFFGVTGWGHTHEIGVVTLANDKLYVAFHGSTFIDDFITDFTFYAHDAGEHGLPGNAHIGFSKALVSCFDNMIAEITTTLSAIPGKKSIQQQLQEKEIVFTGHSLGGALATLAAGRFSKTYHESVPPLKRALRVITFSAPKIGDLRLCESIESLIGKFNILRFVNTWDIIPRIAPAGGMVEDGRFVRRTISYYNPGVELSYSIGFHFNSKGKESLGKLKDQTGMSKDGELTLDGVKATVSPYSKMFGELLSHKKSMIAMGLSAFGITSAAFTLGTVAFIEISCFNHKMPTEEVCIELLERIK